MDVWDEIYFNGKTALLFDLDSQMIDVMHNY